jgi:hypothetical protein
MKTITKIKQLTTILVVLICIIIFTGCKKTDFKSGTNTTETSNLESAKAYVQKRITEMGGVPMVFPVNKKMDFYRADKNGVPKDPKVTTNSFGCTNYDYPDYVDFVQYQRIYDCGANSGNGGYYLQWEYNVSWSKQVVKDNGITITQGWIEIVNDFTSSTDLTLGVQNVTITDLGVGSYPPNHVYNVKFNFDKTSTHDGIDDYFVNGTFLTNYTIKLSATFATDCPDDISLWSVPATAYGFTGNNGMSPCDRNDYVYFLEPDQFANKDRIGIAGYDGYSLCSGFGGSFVRTDLQQVQYSLDAGATWDDFINEYNGVPMGNPILADGYIELNDFAESDVLTPGNYTVIIRFRNWKYTGSVPSPLVVPTITTGLPNSACKSPDNQSLPTAPERAYSEWAYEIWPLIKIY